MSYYAFVKFLVGKSVGLSNLDQKKRNYNAASGNKVKWTSNEKQPTKQVDSPHMSPRPEVPWGCWIRRKSACRGVSELSKGSINLVIFCWMTRMRSEALWCTPIRRRGLRDSFFLRYCFISLGEMPFELMRFSTRESDFVSTLGTCIYLSGQVDVQCKTFLFLLKPMKIGIRKSNLTKWSTEQRSCHILCNCGANSVKADRVGRREKLRCRALLLRPIN